MLGTISRIVIARGRDAADVPITMVFANHRVEKFRVVTDAAACASRSHRTISGVALNSFSELEISYIIFPASARTTRSLTGDRQKVACYK